MAFFPHSVGAELELKTVWRSLQRFGRDLPIVEAGPCAKIQVGGRKAEDSPLIHTKMSRPARLAAASVLAAAAAQSSLAQQIPAFSGADGAAAHVTGGRGGIVYHVTKLDKNFSDSGPGTLRYGLTDSNFPAGTKRTIVFDVAGTFWLGRYGAERGHDNGWDTQSRINIGSNVTIAGQTAPGPVNIMGGVVKMGGSNVVLRNVMIAPGYGLRGFYTPETGATPTPGTFPDSYVFDALDISGQNLMIDHVTTVYATDETISANETANNITIQYSNISQGQNYPQRDAEGGGYTGHALGSLLQAGSNAKISVHHNLYAHQKGRLPRVGSEDGTGAYNDFRNNVFYNWLGTAGTGAGGQPSYNNFVNNFYLAGPGGDNPAGGSSTAVNNVAGGTGIFNGSNSTGTRVYHLGNLKDTNKDGDALDGVGLTNADFGSSSFQPAPLWSGGTSTYHGVTDTATVAYSRVLDYVGATWWDRSAVDARLVHETRTGTGKITAWADDPFNSSPTEGAEWRAMLALRADPSTGAAPFSRAADWDTDQDGMPDLWEIKHGLSPFVANNNGDFDSDGYTDLEEYLNDIAAWPAPNAITFSPSVSNRYAQIQNWHLLSTPTANDVWQPSRFDTARITSGAVVVDAVGQAAGTLQVTGSGTLSVTAGWIEISGALENSATVDHADGLVVANSVIIGKTAAGTYNLSGGVLDTLLLTKDSFGGSFSFTGGELRADVVNFSLINNGGTIAPGHSIGTTQIVGDLIINSGTLDIELASSVSNDLLTVTGSAALAGDLDIVLLGDYLPEPGASWTILSAVNGITGSFSSISEGYRVDIVGQTLLLTYVPEPASAMAILSLIGLTCGRSGLRRRARRP